MAMNKCGGYYSHQVGYLVSYICSQKHIFHATFFSYGMTSSVQSSKGRHSLLPVSLSAVGQLEALLSGCPMLRAVVAKDGLTERRVQQRGKWPEGASVMYPNVPSHGLPSSTNSANRFLWGLCNCCSRGYSVQGSSDAFPGLSTGMLDDRPLGVLHMSCTGTPVDVRVELRLHRSVCLARQRSLVCHEFGFIMALLRVSHLRVQQLIGTMPHQPGA
jgi:hypothetical protein